MSAEEVQPDFANDDSDGLASVTRFPNEHTESASEQVPDSPEPTKNGMPGWLKSKYSIGLAVLIAGSAGTVATLGPDKFVQTVSELSLPTFSDGNARKRVIDQKFAELEAQTRSAKELAQTVNNQSSNQASDIQQSADTALQVGEVNKASVQRLNENLVQILERVEALEQEVLMIATSTQNGGVGNVSEKLNDISGAMAEIASDVDTNTKNFGWLANRTKALEQRQESTQEPVSSSTDKQVQNKFTGNGKPAVEKSPWVVKLANFNAKLGFLLNTVTGQKLRVKPGVDVPNCGKVTAMSAETSSITAGSCVISRG